MYGAISAVIVALILTLGALFGVGAFSSPEYTYATVNHKDGYLKIGVIKGERIFTRAETLLEGNITKQGSFEEIINYFEGLEGVEFRKGFEIRMYSGIIWTGSESNFTLTTHKKILKSYGDLKVVDAITALNQLEKDAQNEREQNAAKALVLGPTPNESFLLSTLINALSK